MGDDGTPGFGAVLRELRDRAGLTQEELAERAGLTPHAVSALERGARTRPYPHTVRALAAGLGADDEQLRRLVEAVPRRTGRGADGAAPSSSPGGTRTPAHDDRSTPMLVPPTPLYGRQRDVDAVCALVRSGERLITITGTGGVGKTRLAAEVARELGAEHPDGVAAVSLAPHADSATVVATAARALGIAGVEGPDSVAQLSSQVGTQQVLLVLDNVEHLLSAAADVAELVAACPRLTVLVTSRSPLRVRAEREHVLQPLELPADEVDTTDELARSSSGALLLDRANRARAVTPGRELGEDDVVALAHLCRRLAGIPLAIELAAAHLRALAPATLLARLDEVIATTGARDLPERQRTMRATLDWSYDLLTDEQQQLFRLLATFRGGASLPAVERVAAACGMRALAVVPLLHELVEHSLVVVRESHDGELRYDLLEPVAQYSRTLLLGPALAAAAAAHAAFFQELAEQAAVGYEHAAQVWWLERMEVEEANVLLAIDRSLDAGDGATAGRIVFAMWLYWWLRGQLVLGRRRAEQCLPVAPPELTAKVHLTAATMSYAAGDLEAAGHHWSESMRLGHRLGDAEVLAKATAGVGLADLAAGDLDAAADRFEAALRHGTEAAAAGVWLRSLTHVWLGTVQLLRGRPNEAVEEVQRGLVLARARGDRLSTYVGLYTLSQAEFTLGEPERARRHLAEGIVLSRETRDHANLAYFLEALAVVESAAGAHSRVPTYLGAARALRDSVGANVYGYYQPDEDAVQTAQRRARAELGDAVYDEALRAGAQLDPQHAAAAVMPPVDDASVG